MEKKQSPTTISELQTLTKLRSSESWKAPLNSEKNCGVCGLPARATPGPSACFTEREWWLYRWRARMKTSHFAARQRWLGLEQSWKPVPSNVVRKSSNSVGKGGNTQPCWPRLPGPMGKQEDIEQGCGPGNEIAIELQVKLSTHLWPTGKITRMGPAESENQEQIAWTPNAPNPNTNSSTGFGSQMAWRIWTQSLPKHCLSVI